MRTARTVRIALAAVTVALALLTPAATAHANHAPDHICLTVYPDQCYWTARDIRVHERPSYTGYGYVNTLPTWCQQGVCDGWYQAPASAPAWIWSNKWVSGPRANKTRVWIVPFASGWSWTWTSSTGWRAMQQHYLSIEQHS